MKQHWKFFASAAAALVWLWVSAALAVPWGGGPHSICPSPMWCSWWRGWRCCPPT